MKTRILVAVLALLSVVALAPAQTTMTKKPMMKKGTMMKKKPMMKKGAMMKKKPMMKKGTMMKKKPM